MNESERNRKLLADISELHTYILHLEKKNNKSIDWSENGFYPTHKMLSNMLMSLSDKDTRDTLIKQYIKEGLSLDVRMMYANALINGDKDYAQKLIEMFQQGENFYYRKVATEGYKKDPQKWDESCKEDVLEYRKEEYSIALARAKNSEHSKIDGIIINTEEYKIAFKSIIDILDSRDLDKEKFETLLMESCKGNVGDRDAVIISEKEYDSIIQTGEKYNQSQYMTARDIQKEQEIYKLLGLIGKGGYSDSKLFQMISFLEESDLFSKSENRQLFIAQLAAGLTEGGKEKFLESHTDLYGLAEAIVLTGKQLYTDEETKKDNGQGKQKMVTIKKRESLFTKIFNKDFFNNTI